MSQIEFITILQNAMFLILKLACPVLMTSMMVGLSISIFQSVTQIQDATLTFVPKILAGILVIIFLAPWMVQLFITSVNSLFGNILTYIR